MLDREVRNLAMLIPFPKGWASKGDPSGRVDSLTTAIHLPRETWELLRDVAFSRAKRRGGRASVSKVLVELVEASRVVLEKEVKN